MSSNLPPGVSMRDLPGNRPEDELWEKLWYQASEEPIGDVQDRYDSSSPEYEMLERIINARVDKLVEEYWSARADREI